MLEPYICSRRSNNVVSKVRGGNRTDVFVRDKFFVFVVSLSETPEPSSGSDDDDGFGIFFGEFNVLVEDLGSCFNFFFSRSFLSLPIEMIVGGNCIGSPARMSFFALNMGIQQA